MSATASASAIHLKLLVPGLFGSVSSSTRVSAPCLETLLARSNRLTNVRADLETLTFELFNQRLNADQDVPVAAVTRVLDLGVVDDGWWLRADPVHLRPDRDRLLLADNTMLQLTQAEADALVAEVMEVYANDGWILKPARPDRWYLKPPAAPEIMTAPLPAVVGRNVHDYLPQGKDAKTWCTILNEIQILLHTARVNSERELRGALTINSLWFWGGGRLPEPQQVPWAKVWASEPLSLALARLSQVPTAAIPASAEEWLAQADAGGEHLLVLDYARGAALYGNLEDWQAFVIALEEKWIEPLLSAMRQGAVDSVTLYTEFAPGFAINAKRARRWWRRR
ncbi:MAG: hypothetical protein R3268_14205, partial [Acidiferrobacterales bacterium]|nr:hypothetical protein [Acidiferrobacterales bacterium]